MNITLNGSTVSTTDTDLAALVRSRGLDPDSLIIEHNRCVVKTQDWASTPVRDGDIIELLNFVGGG